MYNIGLTIFIYFQHLREDQQLFDITLVAGDGNQVPAHKVILAATSKFFCSILSKNSHAHPLVFLKGVAHKDLVSLLDFMYEGEVTVGQEELNSFLEAGQTLGMRGLTRNKTGLVTEAVGATGGEKKQKNPKIARVQGGAVLVKTEVEETEQVEFYDDNENNSGDMRFDGDAGKGDLDPFLDLGVKGLSGPSVLGGWFEKGRVPNEVSFVKSEVQEESLEEVELPEIMKNIIDFPNIKEISSPLIMNPSTEQRLEMFYPYVRSSSDTGKKVWQCILCAKPYQQKSKVIQHVENIHMKGVFRYPCPHCSKVMETFKGQENHTKVHNLKED